MRVYGKASKVLLIVESCFEEIYRLKCMESRVSRVRDSKNKKSKGYYHEAPRCLSRAREKTHEKT